MMAARTMEQLELEKGGESAGVVTACESYLPMVKLMRKVLRHNGLEKKIRVINKRSDELKVGVDVSSRADVLVRFLVFVGLNFEVISSCDYFKFIYQLLMWIEGE